MNTIHTHDALAAHLRRQLVTTLQQAGAIRSTPVQQAFLTIPREVFVPDFYQQDTTSSKMAWKHISIAQTSPEEYLTAIYHDQPLVTKVDERNWPISSSSMPSVMAKMLEALNVQPEQHVLEIGTGSGYNAALLAYITGKPQHIVTIEQDATLTTQAAKALEEIVGEGATVITGDGFAGWKQAAPYDRIIATASASTLPLAWMEQLQPKGKLVMDLQGSLESSFLVAEKTTEGLQGHFLSEPLHFMPLITEELSRSRIPELTQILQQPCHESFTLQKEHAFPNVLFNPAFRWFLQWRIRGCQISKRKQIQSKTGRAITSIFIIEPASKTTVRLQQEEETLWSGNVYGSSAQFWYDLQQAYEDFLSLGKPQQSCIA